MARKSSGSNLWPHFAIFLLLAASLPLQAQNTTKTNQAAVSYEIPFTLNSSHPSEVFMERFLQEAISADDIVFDRLSGPSPQLTLARRQNSLGYGFLDRLNAAGASLMSDIGLDSLRTAAIEALSLDQWADRWQGGFVNFLARTVGNPEEERIEMTSGSYSAVRSSWESLNERATFQWGARPWGTTPYLYILAHAGRLGGRPLVLFEGRGGYSLFGSVKIEARLTLQLPGAFRFAAGTSVDPSRLSHESSATHIGVTLERVLHSNGLIADSVFYIGFRSGLNSSLPSPRPENMFVTGLSKRW